MQIFKDLNIDQELFGAYSGFTWQSQTRSKHINSINPSTQSELGTVWAASHQDIDHIISNATSAFQQWRLFPSAKRGGVIREIGEFLRQKKEVLSDLIVLEMGKTKSEALGEVQEMIDMADFAIGQSRMLYGNTMHSERFQHRLYEQWHPLGIVGVFTSFNFPMAVWSWNAFIAIICGNVVIWKPSSKTPLCAIAIHKICQQVLKKNKLPDIFSLVLPESRELSENIVKDIRIPLISFTGSTASGQNVAKIVAERLGRSILELGGNNAVIIDKTANLKLAIPAIVFGAVGTAGQRCTSTRRIFIHETKFEEVKAKLLHAYQQIKIGDPMCEDCHMGPLIDESAVKIYLDAIKEIKANGGKVLFGGKCVHRKGFFVEPTLVLGMSNSHPLIQKETFAPLLYLLPFKHIDDAIALQNAVPQGLSSSLFSESLVNVEHFLSVIGSDCGIANINVGTSGAEITGAFGGEKATGGGREAGSDAWKAYMRRQTNTINWGEALPLAQGIKFDLN